MNDWFWLPNRVQVSNMQWVIYNISFGTRLSVFQFQLDHLLAVWTCANYLSPLNLSILICKIRIMVHIPRFVSKVKWHDTYQALKRIPHTWKVSVSGCYGGRGRSAWNRRLGPYWRLVWMPRRRVWTVCRGQERNNTESFWLKEFYDESYTTERIMRQWCP